MWNAEGQYTNRERSKTAPLKITRVRHPLVHLRSDSQLRMFLMLLKFSPPPTSSSRGNPKRMLNRS
jgi:hypothetical protein